VHHQKKLLTRSTWYGKKTGAALLLFDNMKGGAVIFIRISLEAGGLEKKKGEDYHRRLGKEK